MAKHKVLIPLDGSPFSQQIIPTVCRLLVPDEYAVILLRVADQPTGPGAMPPRPLAFAWPIEEYRSAQDATYARHPIYASQVEQGTRAGLACEVAGEQYALEAAGYSVMTVVRFGDPAQQIVDVADAMRADLVAMATHGRTGLKHLLMGSVAAEVLRTLSVPLLLVRPQHDLPATVHLAAPRTIVVSLDGSAFAEQALAEAQVLAANSDASLVLAAAMPISSSMDTAAAGVVPGWVTPDTLGEQERLSQYLVQLKERLTLEGLRVDARLFVGSPPEVILQVSEEKHADLIVMATHGRAGLGRLFLGSVASEVLHTTNRPVLLVRPREHAAQLRGNKERSAVPSVPA